MSIRHRPLLALVILSFVFACADGPTGPTDGAERHQASPGVDPAALAMVVAIPKARAALFKALQGSPYSEHKVILQDFVRSVDGAPLITELAKLEGTTPLAAKMEILGGPSLDLYIPSAVHRKAWTGTGVPVIADSRQYASGHLPVWASTGMIASIDPRLGSTAEVLLLVQPSEPKAFRIGLYGETPGNAVESPGETQEGGLVIRTGRDGRRDTIQLAELARHGRDPDLQLAQACPDDHPEWCAGGGSGGGGTGQDDPVWQTLGTTYLTSIGTQGVCDNNLCGLGDDNEFEFTGYWRYGNVEESNTIRRTGVPSTGIVSGLHLWLLNRETTLQAPISVTLVETDVVGDDEFGTVQLSAADLNRNVFWFTAYPSITPYVAAKFTW